MSRLKSQPLVKTVGSRSGQVRGKLSQKTPAFSSPLNGKLHHLLTDTMTTPGTCHPHGLNETTLVAPSGKVGNPGELESAHEFTVEYSYKQLVSRVILDGVKSIEVLA